jgi:hypothetical protein
LSVTVVARRVIIKLTVPHFIASSAVAVATLTRIVPTRSAPTTKLQAIELTNWRTALTINLVANVATTTVLKPARRPSLELLFLPTRLLAIQQNSTSTLSRNVIDKELLGKDKLKLLLRLIQWFQMTELRMVELLSTLLLLTLLYGIKLRMLPVLHTVVETSLETRVLRVLATVLGARELPKLSRLLKKEFSLLAGRWFLFFHYMYPSPERRFLRGWAC